MTMQWRFIMRIKPASVYENIRIYYIIIVLNLLHVSVTLYGHLQGGVLRRICYKDNQANVQTQNIF